ncbi:hypothetical protein DES53_11029 [Roseimicrobium gellanilyticum]|uniref:Uncharacterized protein n=1 Tax=Roseimicrobium gellanilyticum TaxID=748857 RepID=A0A366HA02_9BACT|nr:tetratricopeptide repeat protein [Roseimicrobium gellanilyticum]RBP39006.1 hypothetical protein DES53_11029 [Roseimicrobium gellanilyticum]
MRSCFRAVLGLVLFLWLALLGDAGACIWLRGTTIEGGYGERSDYTGAQRLAIEGGESPEKRLLGIKLSYSRSNEPSQYLNDDAVEKLMLGDAKAAAQDLEAVEKAHPGHYYTAANLGTAYELSGDDEKALQWILEGIRRDPDAHMRTEWLHVRILEAKIKLKSDPAWLERNSISGIDFGAVKKSGYKLTTLQGALNGAELHKSLWTQLSVRMLFVEPQDPIVAQLLYELALVEAQTKFLEEAKEYLNLAETYGLSSERGKPLIKTWNRVIWWSKLGEIVLWIVGLPAIFIVPIWLMRRLKRVRADSF